MIDKSLPFPSRVISPLFVAMAFSTACVSQPQQEAPRGPGPFETTEKTPDKLVPLNIPCVTIKPSRDFLGYRIGEWDATLTPDVPGTSTNEGNVNNGYDSRIRVTNGVPTLPVQSRNYRSLIKFDVNNAPIPSGARILSANIRLTPLESNTSGTLAVYPVTTNWSESGVTYNSFFPSTNPKVNYISDPTVDPDIRFVSFNGTQVVNIEVTDKVAKWRAGLAPNDGLLLAPYASNEVDGSFSFGAPSRDATDTANVPSMTICYDTSQWVMGYYTGYGVSQYPISNIDWSSLTHIAFAPLLVNADAGLNFTFDEWDPKGSDDAKAVAQAAHAHHVTALLMLGGAGSNQGINIGNAAQSSNRSMFVKQLLDAVSTLGYDGIDLDWEGSQVNLDDLVALAQDLRAAKPDLVITYPGATINPNYQSVDPHMVVLAKSLDHFNVMSYYPDTAWVSTNGTWGSWFNSPLSNMIADGGRPATTPVAIDQTLAAYVDAGIPKIKLGMGVGFYVMCYTGGITGPRQPMYSNNAIEPGFSEPAYALSDFYAAGSTYDTSNMTERNWDSYAQVPYLSFASPLNDSHCGALPTQYVSYENENSLIAKGTFSKANGYGGIIAWDLAGGYLPAGASGGRLPNALTQALKKGFLDP